MSTCVIEFLSSVDKEDREPIEDGVTEAKDDVRELGALKAEAETGPARLSAWL
jgi:hypothetical protein